MYHLGKPFTVDRYTITIVSRQSVDGRQIARQGVALLCSKQPAYVVVQDGQGSAVLDMTGAKVPLDEVAALCPDVAKL